MVQGKLLKQPVTWGSAEIAAVTTASSTTLPAGSVASFPRSRSEREVIREVRHSGALASTAAICAGG